LFWLSPNYSIRYSDALLSSLVCALLVMSVVIFLVIPSIAKSPRTRSDNGESKKYQNSGLSDFNLFSSAISAKM
jgi:competence protein ComGC